MALLTREDLRRHRPLTWVCLAVLLGVAVWFWDIDKREAAKGTLAALVGCLGLILPPRERMAILPQRLRALPRSLDAAPVLMTLVTSPGYGLNWFYGVNPYDEVVHLFNGALAGALFAALVRADGRARRPGRLALLGAGFGLALGVGWEMFEWATGLIGDWTDTWTDVVLTAGGATLAAALAGARWPGRETTASRLAARGVPADPEPPGPAAG